MSYSFTPKTEDEVQAEQLCPEGLFPFTVLQSSEVTSKSEKNTGKPMIKLKIALHADDGFDYHIYEYIADWFMAHKFRHFFFAIGLGKDYEAGNVDASNNAYADRSGWCDVGIQKAKGEFPAKNVVRDFKPQGEDAKAAGAAAKPKSEPQPPKAQPAPEPPDDDVPF